MRWSERPPAVRSRLAQLALLHFGPHALSVAVAHLVLVRRMNTRRVAYGLLVLLALLAGYLLGLRLTLAEGAKKAFVDLGDIQRLASVISASALDRLESDDIEGAKRLLAVPVAAYYHSDMKGLSPANQAMIRKRIEEISAHSPTLKQALEKPSR
jgi:hypothetical protein